MASKRKDLLRHVAGRLGFHIARRSPVTALDCLLIKLIRASDVNVVIDVGGNVGGYGAMLRRAGYPGTIVSFEPVTQTFARLQRRSEHDPLWRVFRLGLGSHATTER